MVTCNHVSLLLLVHIMTCNHLSLLLLVHVMIGGRGLVVPNDEMQSKVIKSRPHLALAAPMAWACAGAGAGVGAERRLEVYQGSQICARSVLDGRGVASRQRVQPFVLRCPRKI